MATQATVRKTIKDLMARSTYKDHESLAAAVENEIPDLVAEDVDLWDICIEYVGDGEDRTGERHVGSRLRNKSRRYLEEKATKSFA